MMCPFWQSLMAIAQGLGRPQVIDGAASTALDFYNIVYCVVRGLKKQSRARPTSHVSHFKELTTQSHMLRPAGYGCDGCDLRCRTGLVGKTKTRSLESESSPAARLFTEQLL